MSIFADEFSESFEKNRFVIWFRKRKFKKGERLPTKNEIMRILNISETTLSHGYCYLGGATGEIGWDNNGAFVKENSVTYIPYEGWYLGTKLVKKCREKRLKIKVFNFPSFEDWVRSDNKIRLEIGAYCCEVRAFSYGERGTTYMFAVSLANLNPLNIYTSQLFCRRFEYEDDMEKLKEWYYATIEEFHIFWKNFIWTNYFTEETNT